MLLLEFHLLLTSHRPVIAVPTDTRLKGAPWFYFEGYKLYHTPTPDMAGGVIVLVRAWFYCINLNHAPYGIQK
jgi:hypothetical protein